MEIFAVSSGRGSAWLERLVRDQEVPGSNPGAPTTFEPGWEFSAKVIGGSAVDFWRKISPPRSIIATGYDNGVLPEGGF